MAPEPVGSCGLCSGLRGCWGNKYPNIILFSPTNLSKICPMAVSNQKPEDKDLADTVQRGQPFRTEDQEDQEGHMEKISTLAAVQRHGPLSQSCCFLRECGNLDFFAQSLHL